MRNDQIGREALLIAHLHGPAQNRLATDHLGFKVNHPRVDAGGGATPRTVGVNLHAFPNQAGFVTQLQGVDFMAKGGQRRRQVLELAWEILVNEKNLQFKRASSFFATNRLF